METDLYSIGAFFCDQHPELVDEVVERSEAIESSGLESWASETRDPGRGGVPHAADRARRALLQGRRRVSTREGWRRPRLVGVVVLALVPARCWLRDRQPLARQAGDRGADRDHRRLGGPDAARRHPAGRAPARRPDAPVTVQVFNDLQCDPCADWNQQVIIAADPRARSATGTAARLPPLPAERVGLRARLLRRGRGRRSRTTSGSSSSSSSSTRTRPSSAASPRSSSNRVAGAILNFNVEQWQRRP